MTAELTANGRTVSASASLGPLPQIVTTTHEPFAGLFDDNIRDLLLQASNPVLRLRVGHLCTQTWPLESRLRPCWWVRREREYMLIGEEGTLPYGIVTAKAPYLPPTPTPEPSSDSEVFLMAPVDLGSLDYGTAAMFTTVCVAPRAASLEPPVLRKPKLQRRRRGDPGANGLEDLVEAYLQWALAESDTVIAEIRRQQISDEMEKWVVEVCCGPTWLAREKEITNEDPWELLVDVGNDKHLGRDSYLELPDEVWREVFQVAVATLRSEFPGLWSLARPPSDLVKHDWAVVWRACDRAYETVGRRHQELGDPQIADIFAEGDASADFDADAWQTVLEKVLAKTDLASLAALLLPTDTAIGFMALDPSDMSLDDFSDELHEWAKEAQRALVVDVPSYDSLRTILALWTEPEVAVRSDWRAAVETLIADRSVARAARYLALKARLARRGGTE